ncbi:MAG TPA: hypothetical protein VFQ36_09590 [Ktedonobacteraceae bacterium]|nr:hypothetical protein [Ktedonobacteraceae bacterium]
MSHIHSTENLVFERLQQQQHEQNRIRQRIHQDKPRLMRSRHLIGGLGAFFVSIGTKLQQVEQQSKHAV